MLRETLMKRRSGITLVEVLIAILVMGVGMISVLVLFPVGILNMRQAMQDDRAANMAANGDATCQAFNLRSVFSPSYLTNPYYLSNTAGLAPFANGVNVLYVDPWPAYLPNPLGGVIPRFTVGTRPATLGNILVSRWFTMEDDLDFDPSGLGEQASGFLTGGSEYTMALLLRLESRVPLYIDLNVVVYKGRSTVVQQGETVYAAARAQGTNTLTISYPVRTPAPALRKSGWVLDITQPAGATSPNAYFYRIVNYADTAAPGVITAETQTPLLANVSSLVVMENVIEVFERNGGTGN